MHDGTMAYAANTVGMMVDESPKVAGAPTNKTLASLLAEKRMRMLSELRDIEQALEALEHQPAFEPTMNRVMKILQRSY